MWGKVSKEGWIILNKNLWLCGFSIIGEAQMHKQTIKTK
jgi:hypothetical protein